MRNEPNGLQAVMGRAEALRESSFRSALRKSEGHAAAMFRRQEFEVLHEMRSSDSRRPKQNAADFRGVRSAVLAASLRRVMTSAARDTLRRSRRRRSRDNAAVP